MNEAENLCMQIIANSGAAKSKYIQAISLARESDFIGANELIETGKGDLQKGYEAHFQMLQKSALEDNKYLSLLLVHAEDQMSSAETLECVASEMVRLYQKING